MNATSEHEAGDGWEDLRQPAETKERSWAPRLIVAGLALLAAAIFIVQNSNHVETQFLFIKGEPRLYNIIIVSMLLGAALGQGIPALWRRRKSRKGNKATSTDEKPSA